MILLDTHAWIWWLAEPRKLSRPAARAIAGANEVAVSPVSCWEVAMLVKKGRLRFDRDVQTWIQQAFARPQISLAELTPRIAVEAAALDALGADPSDCLIVATAQVLHVPIVTKDERIHRFPGVRAVW